MGCINNTPKIIIRSMKTFKQEARKNLEHKQCEDSANKEFTSSSEEENDTSHSSLEQSQIPIKAKMEDNELIFL